MSRTFKESLSHRRSYYALGSEMFTSRQELEEMIAFALKNVPSAFNSQSTRIVLLLEKAHHTFWSMVKKTIKEQIPAESYCRSEKKINQSFDSGYGTILFFEDQETIRAMQKRHPLYAESFPQWSQHTSAMHQLVLWCMLEDTGLGASLQHYNPLIDKQVKSRWNIPESWDLVAQMPFGYPPSLPLAKEEAETENRMLTFC